MCSSPVKKLIVTHSKIFLKRAGGIEPPLLAWKAKVLPLNYARTVLV